MDFYLYFGTLLLNKAITEANEDLKVHFWNTKEGGDERMWVFEHLDTE